MVESVILKVYELWWEGVMPNKHYVPTEWVNEETPTSEKMSVLDSRIASGFAMSGEAVGLLSGDDSVIDDPTIATEFKVVASSPADMIVNVNAGYAVVSGALVRNESSTAKAIVAPTSSNRYTIIMVNNEGVIDTKDSAEAGSPTEPSPDADNITLAAIYLPQNTTKIEDASGGFGYIIDRRDHELANNSDASTSGTGEDDLQTTVIPADALGTTGGLRITAAGTKTNANGNKTIKFYLGATSVTVHAAANDTNDWRVEVEIFNTSTSAQRLTWKGYNGTTLLQGYDTMAEDTTADLTLKFTGECAHASDTITQTMFIVERFY